MWLSTLPTGTVSDENRGDRTFPRSSPADDSQPPQHTESAANRAGRPTAAHTTEIQQLRDETRRANREIQRLEAECESLRAQVARQQTAKQAIVDRYERVIRELETAAATARSNESTQGSDARARRWTHPTATR